MQAPPYPPTKGYLNAIRNSSNALRKAAGVVIQPSSIRRLLLSTAFTSSFQRVSASHGLAFPLKFASVLEELNFISILSLLNFASGYRIPLHRETGRGAWDNIRAFTFSLYLTSTTGEGDYLSAKGLKTITEAKVAELLRVNVHVERPHHAIPGVTVGQLGGPMYDLVKIITEVLNETGSILVDSGYLNLGAFVLESLQHGANAAEASDAANDFAEVVLERLVKAFPGFRDMAEISGQPVYCFKKALFLIHAITIRFGSMRPPPFPIPSTEHLPVFTDNVLPSILVHLGVIDISSAPMLTGCFPDASNEARITSLIGETTSVLPALPKSEFKEGPVLTKDQAYILRAAAIDACEMIVDIAQSISPADLIRDGSSLGWITAITLPDLDMWLWAVAKDRTDYRKLERFVLRDTAFF
ncbi:hypothetical protein BDN72DRAFT_757828 [Pluteus cervinus]|uniref:Uncharacterized protein n=1 Tax=Pluteus cervinus TaxID=181527 RepID=A0ACD3BBL3_9AGAR|nr:hypothetical protein BDN72DRAFT_757828 [Pluteus cervinus]